MKTEVIACTCDPSCDCRIEAGPRGDGFFSVSVFGKFPFMAVDRRGARRLAKALDRFLAKPKRKARK